MSVRDAAGRHPRLTRGVRPTDRSGGDPSQSRPRRRVQAHRVGADGVTFRGRPAPLLICLVAIAFALAEAVASAAAGPGQAPAVAADLPARVASAIGPSRVDARPDLAADARPLGAAPLRTVPRLFGASASVLASAAVRPAPRCTYDDVPAPDADLDHWATTIVDTAFVLPDGYHPRDLVPVGRAGIGGWGVVRSFVIDDLHALARAANAAGNPVAVQSAYRTRARQAEVFGGWVASAGEDGARQFSARPGHSEHQLGTALDLRAAAGGAPWSGAFGATAAGRWLAKHAHEFGFVLSYPKGADAATCYGAEAWHVRYVGRSIAAEVAASGLPLRVWLWRFGSDR
jgi:D-alanyl-D-alanine carboxypeptidase